MSPAFIWGRYLQTSCKQGPGHSTVLLAAVCVPSCSLIHGLSSGMNHSHQGQLDRSNASSSPFAAPNLLNSQRAGLSQLADSGSRAPQEPAKISRWATLQNLGLCIPPVKLCFNGNTLLKQSFDACEDHSQPHMLLTSSVVCSRSLKTFSCTPSKLQVALVSELLGQPWREESQRVAIQLWYSFQHACMPLEGGMFQSSVLLICNNAFLCCCSVKIALQ